MREVYGAIALLKKEHFVNFENLEFNDAGIATMLNSLSLRVQWKSVQKIEKKYLVICELVGTYKFVDTVEDVRYEGVGNSTNLQEAQRRAVSDALKWGMIASNYPPEIVKLQIRLQNKDSEPEEATDESEEELEEESEEEIDAEAIADMVEDDTPTATIVDSEALEKKHAKVLNEMKSTQLDKQLGYIFGLLQKVVLKRKVFAEKVVAAFLPIHQTLDQTDKRTRSLFIQYLRLLLSDNPQVMKIVSKIHLTAKELNVQVYRIVEELYEAIGRKDLYEATPSELFEIGTKLYGWWQ